MEDFYFLASKKWRSLQNGKYLKRTIYMRMRNFDSMEAFVNSEGHLYVVQTH